MNISGEKDRSPVDRRTTDEQTERNQCCNKDWEVDEYPSSFLCLSLSLSYVTIRIELFQVS